MIGAITAGIFNIPNPAAADFTVIVEKAADGTPIQTDTQTSALYGLSMLHTLFNTINTLILIWFIPFIEKLVCMIIKGSANKEENAFRLKLAFDGKLEEIANAYAAEDRFNNLRNNLRDEEIESIENERKNYQTSVYYMDIVSELEKMGDFMINISQVLLKYVARK